MPQGPTPELAAHLHAWGWQVCTDQAPTPTEVHVNGRGSKDGTRAEDLHAGVRQTSGTCGHICVWTDTWRTVAHGQMGTGAENDWVCTENRHLSTYVPLTEILCVAGTGVSMQVSERTHAQMLSCLCTSANAAARSTAMGEQGPPPSNQARMRQPKAGSF